MGKKPEKMIYYGSEIEVEGGNKIPLFNKYFTFLRKVKTHNFGYPIPEKKEEGKEFIEIEFHFSVEAELLRGENNEISGVRVWTPRFLGGENDLQGVVPKIVLPKEGEDNWKEFVGLLSRILLGEEECETKNRFDSSSF